MANFKLSLWLDSTCFLTETLMKLCTLNYPCDKLPSLHKKFKNIWYNRLENDYWMMFQWYFDVSKAFHEFHFHFIPFHWIKWQVEYVLNPLKFLKSSSKLTFRPTAKKTFTNFNEFISFEITRFNIHFNFNFAFHRWNSRFGATMIIPNNSNNNKWKLSYLQIWNTKQTGNQTKTK